MSLLSTLPQQKFDNTTAELRQQAYWVALQELGDDVFMAAVGRCLRTQRFMPTPADVIQAARRVLEEEGLFPDDPEVAWERVQRWASHCLYGGERPNEINDAAARTVKELGGIRAIGMTDLKDMPFVRKDFIKRYSVYREREIMNDTGIFAQSLPEGPRVDLKALQAGRSTASRNAVRS